MDTNRRCAICSWSLQPPDPPALVRDVLACGAASVQLALSPLVAEPAIWSEAPDRLGDAGMSIVSGMMAMAGEDYSTLASIARTGGVRPDATWAANLDHARAVADVAAELGLDLVTFHAGFLPHEPDDPERAVLLERLRELATLFARNGLRLGLETGQESADTLAAFLDDLAAPTVGVNFDPANMILYGMGDPVRALERLLPSVVQAHIKDAVPTTTPGEWGTEVPVGTGAVDWPRFCQVLGPLDPPVPLVVEREAGAERITDIRTALALMEQLTCD